VEIVTSVSALLTNDVAVTIDFIGHAQHLGEDLHLHCEKADLILRNDELWVVQAGQRKRLSADEPESNPVKGLLDTILDGKPDYSPPESALPVYDLTQAILTSGRTGVPVKLA
jgi:predicted dehydrogenase